MARPAPARRKRQRRERARRDCLARVRLAVRKLVGSGASAEEVIEGLRLAAVEAVMGE